MIHKNEKKCNVFLNSLVSGIQSFVLFAQKMLKDVRKLVVDIIWLIFII